MIKRLALNLFGGWYRMSRWFPRATLMRLRDAIATGERRHAGELRVAIEARYSPWPVLAGWSPRQRAEHVFALLRVWDTRANTGVLLYLQLAERRVELLADRGIAARVGAGEWQAVCDRLAADLRGGPAEAAVLAAIARVHDLLATHFPATPDNPRELPDVPFRIR